MNELELSISMKERAKTIEDMNWLNCEDDKLDELTDSLILESRTAWENYRNLEDDCRTSASKYVGMDALKDLCRKTERLAQDLLCYSLARFRQKKHRTASTPTTLS
jgi:hypothetical protein